MVRPTISGRIIERRDHVLMGRRSFAAAAASTFLYRCRSTNGPFFNDLGTGLPSPNQFLGLLLAAATNNHIARAFVFASLVPFGWNTPRSNRVTSTRRTPF